MGRDIMFNKKNKINTLTNEIFFTSVMVLYRRNFLAEKQTNPKHFLNKGSSLTKLRFYTEIKIYQ